MGPLFQSFYVMVKANIDVYETSGIAMFITPETLVGYGCPFDSIPDTKRQASQSSPCVSATLDRSPDSLTGGTL